MSFSGVPASLTDRFGQDLTVTVTTGGTHSVAGTVSGATATAMNVRAIVRDATAKAIDGVSILAGDVIVTLPVQDALTVAPIAGATRATIDGVDRLCASVRLHRRSGSVIAYTLVMRGAA